MQTPRQIRLHFKLMGFWGFGDDPMIGKIIAHDHNRSKAINKLITFLERIEIKGIKTNIPFLISLLNSEAFQKGMHHTKYIESNLKILNNKGMNGLSRLKDSLTKNTVKVNRETIKIVETDKAHQYRKASIKESGGMKVVFFD